MSESPLPTLPENEDEYKKQLLSRQLLAVGAEAQKKYAATDVLVVGVTGLGLELVKNLVLSGVRSMTLLDDAPVEWTDLSSLFYASPADVGQPRAQTVLKHVCELNRFVKVTVAPPGSVDPQSGLVRDELLQAHSVAVFVDKRTTLLAAQNERCRALGVKMVCCESRGVACSIFVDGGAGDFTVLDKNGEDTVLCVVADILSDGTVYLSDDKKHELEVGDIVYFLDLPGVHGEFLNSHPPTRHGGGHGAGHSTHQQQQEDGAVAMKMIKVKQVLNPYTIQIELPAGWEAAGVPQLARGGGAESVGGFMQTTKAPVVMRFDSLAAATEKPNFFGIIDDDPKLCCEGSLHSIFRAIHGVAARVQSDNVTNSLDDVLAAGKAIDADIDEALLKSVASAFHGNLGPMATFVGGVAAQEVLKLASGKYCPIAQWMYYDVRELVQLRPDGAAASEFAPRKTRYDGQIAVIGQAAQQRLLDGHCFIVGAGALGCEHIKNVAMMGLGCTKQGKVTITDMDSIELSNLSRQFLFRQHHVQQRRTKSSVAAEAAVEMNAALNIEAMEHKVGADTANIFNEKFWHAQTVVLNALDNVPARLYVDEQCVHNQRPLFESGTNGPKLNTQCVVPFLTENYGATRDPPEKEFALCTLKHFPNAIEHTIHWAKEAFGTEFTAIPSEVNSYIHQTDQWRAAVARDPSAKAGAFKQIVDALASVPTSWADCVAWARLKFEDYFVNEIKQLMYNLPLGSERDGKPVWGGAKRPPVPAVFDPACQAHADFIIAAACLRAETYGVAHPSAVTLAASPDAIAEMGRIATAVKIPEWHPKKTNISTDASQKAAKEDDGSDPASAASSQGNSNLGADGAAVGSGSVSEAHLPPPEKFQNIKLSVQEFEKDDDTNFHVDFMTAVSNLRATNYGIPTATRDHTKFVAGKIIPAMITTTACATGLVGLEVLKFFMGAAELGQYRNTFMNLAVPLWTLTMPTPAAKAKSYTTSGGKEISFTNWDRIDIGDGSRDLTLQEVVDALKERYDIDTDMISTSTAKLVYTGPFTKKDKLKMPICDILKTVGFEVKPDEETVALIATGTSNDVDLDIPAIQYRFRGQCVGFGKRVTTD